MNGPSPLANAPAAGQSSAAGANPNQVGAPLTLDQRVAQLEIWVHELWCCCCWCQKEIGKLNGVGRTGVIIVITTVLAQVYHALSGGIGASVSHVRIPYVSTSSGIGASRAFAFAGPGEITHSDGIGGSAATYAGATHQSYTSQSDGLGDSAAAYSGVTHSSIISNSGGIGASVATYSGPVAQSYTSGGANGVGASVATATQP